jgi:hypothetical protein
MKGRASHVVPVEAIRQGITADGAITLARLAAEGAQLHPDAVVELFPNGWVASLIYTRPGFPARTHLAHVGLVWAPRENALPQDPPA